jgi:hypothetical protein
MPKTASEKCRLCAKLSAEEAIARHGPTGTNCWDGEKCHKRRTYYRKRDQYNKDKRLQYRKSTGKEVIHLNLSVPVSAKAELFLYRKNKSVAPHAIVGQLTIGGKVYLDGIHPDVHFNKQDPDEFKSQCNHYIQQFFEAFSVLTGTHIHEFDFIHERSSSLCPICQGEIPEKQKCSLPS